MLKGQNQEYFCAMSNQTTASPYDVMIVEDDKDFRNYLNLFFNQQGLHCLCAENGREALDLLLTSPEELHPKVALVDIMMPLLDGPGFVRRLGEIGLGQQMEIIIATTSLVPPKISHRGQECKVIEKPYDTYQLMKLVRSLTPATEANTRAIL